MENKCNFCEPINNIFSKLENRGYKSETFYLPNKSFGGKDQKPLLYSVGIHKIINFSCIV